VPNTALGVTRTASALTAVQSAATGRPAYSQTMPCEGTSARRARHLVTSALNTWGLSCLADVTVLATSELVGNAIAHSSSRHIRVTVARTDPLRVRVAVVDESHALPELRTVTPGEESGRGLAVVEELSDRWGSDRLPWGKRVWVELAATRLPGRRPL